MAFLNKRQSVWLSDEVVSHISYLRMNDPERFSSVGSVVRIAIMKLYNQEVKDGRRQKENM